MNPWLLQLINQGLIHGPKISQYAQNVARGGSKLFDKGISSIANTTMGQIPQYLQSLATGSKFVPKQGGAITNVVGPAMTAPYLANPKEGLEQGLYLMPGATEALNQITGGEETGVVTDAIRFGGDLIDVLWEDTQKEKEDKKEDKKETKESKESKESKDIYEAYNKKQKEPSIDDLPLDAEEAKKLAEEIKRKKNLHKGGYVKKQRKRKPYKSSTFAKMKKSKKRKYI